jgi:hypothetical protein
MRRLQTFGCIAVVFASGCAVGWLARESPRSPVQSGLLRRGEKVVVVHPDPSGSSPVKVTTPLRVSARADEADLTHPHGPDVWLLIFRDTVYYCTTPNGN